MRALPEQCSIIACQHVCPCQWVPCMDDLPCLDGTFAEGSGSGMITVVLAQDLAFEARLLLWAMVEHNMRTLSDFIKCNMEDLATPRVADHQYWVDMLVIAYPPAQVLFTAFQQRLDSHSWPLCTLRKYCLVPCHVPQAGV